MLKNHTLALKFAVSLGMLGFAHGQTVPPVTQTASQSPCANIVALSGAKVDCSNLSAEQKMALSDIPSILKLALENQNYLDEIMKKLNEMSRNSTQPTIVCKDNANCGISSGQIGGITAGQVNIGVHDWETTLDGDKQKTLIESLEQVHGKFRLTWLFQDIGGMKMVGFLNYAFIQAQWTPDQIENYTGSMCYPDKQSDCIGLYVAVKDRNSKIAKTAIDAISAFVPDPHITESTTVPDERVDIFVARAN